MKDGIESSRMLGCAPERLSFAVILGAYILAAIVGAIFGDLFTVGMVSLVWLGAMGLYRVIRGPKGVRLHFEAPSRVAVGDEFDLTLALFNCGKRPHRIIAVYIDGDYLQGMEILGSDPKWTDVSPREHTHEFDEFLYDFEISPGDVQRIALRARMNEAGSHSGYIRVCIDNYLNSVVKMLTTVSMSTELNPVMEAST